MNEKPILFNAEMVNAILSGRKTQTRRIMKVQPSEHFHPQDINGAMDFTAHWYTPGVIDKDGYLQPARKDVFGVADEDEGYTCPLGAVGDQLWVRETWARYNIDQTSHDMAYRATTPADWPKDGLWRPSIHMPRWASRINLLITGVRVDRLQDISELDALAEGLKTGKFGNEHNWREGFYLPGDNQPHFSAKTVFRELWNSIYGQKKGESWEANPWVWVIEFERMEAK